MQRHQGQQDHGWTGASSSYQQGSDHQDRTQPPSSPSNVASHSQEQLPPSTGIIVDMDAIANEKENIMPIKKGRSATTLSHLFTTPHDDRAQELAMRHQAFQQELEHVDELDDPLDVYVRYVKWTVENYPQGTSGPSHESNLMSLLEDATDMFRTDGRYRNDPRHVKLYVLYAEMVERPADVYQFMMSNGIGSEISMFYEEFADFYESTEQLQEARDIFQLGINRGARPLMRLKMRYQEFEARVAMYEEEQERAAIEAAMLSSSSGPTRSQQQQQQQQRSSASNSNSNTPAQRQALGAKNSLTNSTSANSTSNIRMPLGSGPFSAPSTSSSQRPTKNNNNNNVPSSKLAVYKDPTPSASSSTGAGSGKNARPGPRPSVQQPQRATNDTPWEDLGTERVRRKENTIEPTPWKGATLSSKDTVPRQRPAKIEVFRDPVPDAAMEDKPRHGGAPGNVLQPVERVAAPPRALALQDSENRQPPQQHYRRPEAPQLTLSNRLPITQRVPNGQREQLMIDLTQVYSDQPYTDEVGSASAKGECSIEEIRARHPKYAYQPQSQPQSPRPRPQVRRPLEAKYVAEPTTPPATLNSSSEQQPMEYVPNTPPPRRRDSQQPPSHLMPVKPVRDDDEDLEHENRAKRRLTSSPTIHTKYASAEMNKIFSDRIRTRRSLESQWSLDDSEEVGQDELDNFTMAYSIPAYAREYLANGRSLLDEPGYQHEDEDDDGYGSKQEGGGGGSASEGDTARYMRLIESGDGSTITMNIEALKRKRAAEEAEEGDLRRQSRGANPRLSLRHVGGGHRNSFRFDPNRTQDPSEITMAIRARKASSCSNTTTAATAHGLSPASTPLRLQPFSDTMEDVPMLEDEAPPSFLQD